MNMNITMKSILWTDH